MVTKHEISKILEYELRYRYGGKPYLPNNRKRTVIDVRVSVNNKRCGCECGGAIFEADELVVEFLTTTPKGKVNTWNRVNIK